MAFFWIGKGAKFVTHMTKARIKKEKKPKIFPFPASATRYSTIFLFKDYFLILTLNASFQYLYGSVHSRFSISVPLTHHPNALPLTHHFSIYMAQFIVGSAFLCISDIMFCPDRGRKQLCLSERAGFIALSSTGKSLRDIADALEISKSVVAYWH
jgi:hypothetical protein